MDQRAQDHRGAPYPHCTFYSISTCRGPGMDHMLLKGQQTEDISGITWMRGGGPASLPNTSQSPRCSPTLRQTPPLLRQYQVLQFPAFPHRLQSFPLIRNNMPVFLLSTLTTLLRCAGKALLFLLYYIILLRRLYFRSPNMWVFHM